MENKNIYKFLDEKTDRPKKSEIFSAPAPKIKRSFSASANTFDVSPKDARKKILKDQLRSQIIRPPY